MQEDSAKRPIDDDPGGLDLRAYLAVVRKRIWIIAAIVALGVTAAVLYTARQPRIYQSTAKIVIDPQPPQVFGSQVQEVIQLGTGSYWSNQEYYNTQVEFLTGFELARRTVRADGLYDRLVPPAKSPDLTDEDRLDLAASTFKRALSAAQGRESRIVSISVRHTDPELAEDLANEHVRSYIAFTKGIKVKGSEDVSKDLAAELDLAEQALRESEQKLYEFKRDNDILSVSLEEKQNILAADIAKYTAAHSDARIKRIELDSVRQRARKLRGEDILESPIFALASNSAIVDALKEQYVREKQKFIEIDEVLGPKNDAHKKQAKKVADLLATIEKEAARAMRELDERFQAALDAEKRFSAEVDRLKKEAIALGPAAMEYNRRLRKQKSDEENYNLVLGRLKTSERGTRNDQTNIRKHEMARGAILVYPRMRLNVAVAFILSLMLGVGLAFLLDYLDRTLKSSEDVERHVGAPLLGIIPVVDDVDRADTLPAMRERDLYVFNNPTSRAAECCRSIRTNILFSSADRPMKTLTVSSPRPREGKTTSTIYLGTTMANAGQRVLIIDTDLRRPRLYKSLGVSREVGITNLILGDVSIDDVIKTTDIPNLYVLPSGPRPPNPAELLLTNRFKEILAELEERFDRILLDSPPLLAVTDAVVLARLSDGVVMVAQAGKSVIDDAVQSAKAIRDVDAPILGVILNDMDLSDRRYGYYYYAYGYGDAPEAEPSS